VTVVRKLTGLCATGDGDAQPAPSRLARRIFPLLATLVLIAVGMSATVWWGPGMAGRTAWSLPDDLWGTLAAAQRLLHLNLAGLYTQPTGLITLPGGALILVPVVALIDLAGLSLHIQDAHNPYPAAWPLAGTYMIALSAVVLFAADAIAEHLAVSRPKRALLATAGAAALASVSVRWGHPEDAVAVGLFLYGILALARSQPARSAWLAGAAIAIQPLVLLAAPVVLMTLAPRRLPGYLARAAAPAAVLLGAAAAANWTATYTAVTRQPNFPDLNHPTPWSALAPHMSAGVVASGPARILSILAACACALAAGRGWRGQVRATGWTGPLLGDVLWWTAVALALRCVFEPVIVSYYLWPPLAVALIAAAVSWARLIPASAAAAALTLVSQLRWPGMWAWWAPMIALLGLTLLFARIPLRGRRAAAVP